MPLDELLPHLGKIALAGLLNGNEPNSMVSTIVERITNENNIRECRYFTKDLNQVPCRDENYQCWIPDSVNHWVAYLVNL